MYTSKKKEKLIVLGICLICLLTQGQFSFIYGIQDTPFIDNMVIYFGVLHNSYISPTRISLTLKSIYLWSSTLYFRPFPLLRCMISLIEDLIQSKYTPARILKKF